MYLTSILLPLGIYALAVPLPGPSFVLIFRSSIADGASKGSAVAFGTTAGVVVYALATIFGLTVLILTLPTLAHIIQALGGMYLLFLGLRLLRAAYSRNGSSAGVAANHTPSQTYRRALLRGLFISLGNPKMAVFFLGLFSPVMSPSMPTSARTIVFCGIVLIDLIYHQCLAQIAAKGRGLTDSVGRWFDTLAGCCMAAFGLRLVVSTFSCKP